jgi:hypothetical protein
MFYCSSWTELIDLLTGVLARFHELCVFAVQQSDNKTADEATAEAAANNETDSTNSSSSSSSSSSPSLLSSAVQDLLSQVADAVCPGQPACNGYGICNNSVCLCNPGN